MPFFTFDNIQVYYEDYGGDKPPLLLLHGNSVSAKMFNKNYIKFYQKHFRVITFDYPGLGRSQRLSYFRDDYWYYNAHFAAFLLDQLGLKKVNVVGTSGGALVGFNLCILRADLVGKMIGDSFMGLGLSLEDSQSIVRKRSKSKLQLMQIAFWKDMNGDDWQECADLDIDLMDRVGKKQLLTIYGDLSSINIPVMCVAASTDELIPNTHLKVKQVADLIPNSKYISYDYGKHPFMITEPNEFKKISLEFLLQI
jgi:pimeloyl-ACP methyl ester carboxylesterase